MTKWKSEWGKPVKVELFREERSLIWDMLHDVRKEKYNQLKEIGRKQANKEPYDSIEEKRLINEMEMIDGIRNKMNIMY